MDDLGRRIARATGLMEKTSSLVVSTGAGISKESGIPTFRDGPSGLWGNFDPEEFATRDGFSRNPELVWRWYVERRRMIARAKPNPGHLAIVELEDLFETFALITQNIDDLHRRAGSKNIIEIHGNIFRFKCFLRDHPVGELPGGTAIPPLCPCGSMIRPDVVWFGEPLPEDSLVRSYEALRDCEAILVVGTSGTVYPAAEFPSIAKSFGAAVIEVNPEETFVTRLADVFLKGPAGQLLPELVEELRKTGK